MGQPAPAGPPAPSLIQPKAVIAGRDASGFPIFEHSTGGPLSLPEDARKAIEALLKPATGAELAKLVTDGKKPKVNASRPYEQDLNRTFGDVQQAIAQRAKTKLMFASDASRLVLETGSLDKDVAATYAARLPLRDPVVVKWKGKLYLHGEGAAEHMAAAIAHAHVDAAGAGRSRIGAEVGVQVVDLDKEQRPARPPKEWAQSQHDVMKRLGDGATTKPEERAAVRESLREQLRAHGIASRDDEPEEGRLQFNTNEGSLSVVPNIPGAYGTHDWVGKIRIRTDVAKAAANALSAIAAEGEAFRNRPIAVQNSILPRLNTFVHEEIHGASAARGSSYRDAGVGMEEAATEILARKVTRAIVGHTSPIGRTALALPERKPDGGYRAEPGDAAPYMGSYNGYIGTLLRETGEVIGHAGVHAKVEAALLKTRSSEQTGRWSTPREHIAAYGKALGLSGARLDDLVQRLEREFVRNPA